MSSTLQDQYVKAIFKIADAEGKLEKITDELYAFSQELGKSRELYNTLSDRSIPFERQNQIVLDLLSKKASAATLGIIALLLGAGRIKDLSKIVEGLAVQVAKQRNQEVAHIRSAVELSDAQITKLKKALEKATKKELNLKIVVDPDLLGGVAATIGDTIIDGSVKTRLQKLREKMETKQ